MTRDLESDFPSVKAIARINSLEKTNESIAFFDCKFYPYTPPGVDPVFAVVGKGEVIVCRPLEETNSGLGIVRWFQDEDPNASLNSCAWTQDMLTGDPLLCVAGSGIPSVKIFNVKTGKLVRRLIGHGKDVNDLAVSPLSPAILASASMDRSVRFWSLDPAHKKQPCMLLCTGEAHREGLLTLAFHSTGRYLLTGGMDCQINLWVIPSLPNSATNTDKPTMIHYPHFSTNAIHSDFVDCVAWYNDLIISKSANESKIVLWRIENFCSSSPSPPPSAAPATHEYQPTRSAFGGTYQRLLQFEAAESTPFWMRFSLFTAPQKRPILVIGNEKSKVFFWDLQTLEEWDGKSQVADSEEKFKLPRAMSATRGRKGVARKIGGNGKQRESSIASNTTTTTTTTNSFNTGLASSGPDIPELQIIGAADLNPSWTKMKYGVEDEFKRLLPHRTVIVPRVTFAARQVAWSVGGEWLVVVGDQGMIALLAR